MSVVAFPKGWDSAFFRDKWSEVSSLARDKGTTGKQENGTTGQAQNLATGLDGLGQPVQIWDGTQDGTITIFLSKSGTGRGSGWDNCYFLISDFLF